MAIIEKPINVFTVANQLGYYEYAPHPVTGQNVRKVDLGRLCTHPNINKWAKYKPHSIVAPEGSYLDGLAVKPHGLYRGGGGGIYYNAPQGGELDPFRVGDFWKYNHNTVAPTSVSISKVLEVDTNQELTKPYKLIMGFEYEITFTLIFGEIDPADIWYETKREKLVGNVSGYGGIVLANAPNVLVDANDVLSGGQNVEKTVVVDTYAMFDFYYARKEYEPQVIDNYYSTQFAIEDREFKNDFSVSLIDFVYSNRDIIPPFVGQTTPSFTARLTNNSGRSFLYTRIRYSYNTNGKLPRITKIVNQAIGTGVNQLNTSLDSLNPDNGSNEIDVIAYIEGFNEKEQQWKEISQTGFRKTINITTT